MQSILFVGSVSNAMRGKRLLEQHGIRAYTRKISSDEHGCGYGLTVASSRSQAMEILREGGVKVMEQQGRGAP